MSTHYLTVQNASECPAFDLIKAGIKTVEGRTYKLKYHSLKIGDTLVFLCNDQSVSTTIIDIKLFSTLEKYVEKEGYEKILPGIESAANAIKMYNDKYWSIEEERNNALNLYGFGFMGIHIIIKNN